MTTVRDALADVLALIDAKQHSSSQAQATVRRARETLAADADPQGVMLVCNTPFCPSRLELVPGTTADECNAIARSLCWIIGNERHICSGCQWSSRRGVIG